MAAPQEEVLEYEVRIASRQAGDGGLSTMIVLRATYRSNKRSKVVRRPP